MTEDDKDAPTTGIIPGKTTTLPRRSVPSREVPGGPNSRSLPEPEVKILAEIERGGPDDFGAGRR